MFISVFDIFKIGVGPSSSHTMGPMTAAAAFLKAVRDGGAAFDPATLTGLEAQLYGSLAFTGKGHATDRAVILGLMGFEPASFDAEFAEARLTEMRATGRLAPPGLPEVAFDPERHVIFDYGPPLAMHANGMKLRALSNGAVLLEETYYSIGGGFIATECQLLASRSRKSAPLGSVPNRIPLAGLL